MQSFPAVKKNLVPEPTENQDAWTSTNAKAKVKVKVPLHLPSNEKKIYCHNCGESGHISKNCALPTTSYGIVLFYPLYENSAIEENPLLHPHQNSLINHKGKCKCVEGTEGTELVEPKPTINYLLIMDRHTPDFAQIIIGNYDLDNLDYVRTLLGRLTQTEAQLLLTYDLRFLFTNYWTFSKKDALRMYQKQYQRSEQLFNRLRRGVRGLHGEIVTWKSLLEETEPHWMDPDWGFPKGRRKRHAVETDLECAKREFLEETGISDEQYHILDDLEPIEELIQGSNGITYRSIYYIAEAKNFIPLYSNPFNRGQQSEVTKIGWYTYDQGHRLIRPYQVSRLHIIRRIHKYLGNLYT